MESGVHPYKHSWMLEKRLTARICNFLTFNICYLGAFSQNFRSVSLFLPKLEPFCRGWLEKFCLVGKIQHFLPYLKTQAKSWLGLDNFTNNYYTDIRWPVNSFLRNYTENHQKSQNFNTFMLTSAIFRGLRSVFFKTSFSLY